MWLQRGWTWFVPSMLRIWASRQVRRGIVGAVAFPCLCVGRLGEPFDRAEAPVPLGGEVSHSPGGLVETVGSHLVENLPALLTPADQARLFKHDQMLGDRLPGERHVPG